MKKILILVLLSVILISSCQTQPKVTDISEIADSEDFVVELGEFCKQKYTGGVQIMACFKEADGNFELCDKLRTETEIQTCKGRVGGKLNYCDTLTGTDITTCYMDVYMNMEPDPGQVEDCEKIPEEYNLRYRVTCRAVMLSDVSQCGALVGTDYESGIDNCITEVAVSTNNPKLCNQLDETHKIICLKATETRN